MMRRLARLALFACSLAVSCRGEDEWEWVDEEVPPEPSAVAPDAGRTRRDSGTRPPDDAPGGTAPLRIVAANISSGGSQKYEAEGIRILQALAPDVALVQEMNYKTNAPADIDELVGSAFPSGFYTYRETAQIPNGIVSRYPIVASGRWIDPKVDNRGFAWAKIEIPGPHPLWAVSVHLLTTGSTNRNEEATALLAELANVVGEGDYLTVGGDLNTERRSERAIDTFATRLATSGPYPADGSGNDSTNAPRNAPYDWVLVDAVLDGHQVPTRIGGSTFERGLVFDSRVYTPLAEVAPVTAADSAVANMQHMPVVRDFLLPL